MLNQIYIDNYPFKNTTVFIKSNGRTFRIHMLAVTLPFKGHSGSYDFFISISGIPINKYWLRHGCKPGITFSKLFNGLLNIPISDTTLSNIEQLDDLEREKICQLINQYT